MTALIGASVFLIAGSAIALVFGWVTADESLIWTSIAASVAGGVCLTLAYVRSRDEVAALGRGTESPATGAPAPVPEQPTPRERAIERPTEEVVAVKTSKRFHRPSCRYAAAKSAGPMAKNEAVRAGYTACGICKP